MLYKTLHQNPQTAAGHNTESKRPPGHYGGQTVCDSNGGGYWLIAHARPSTAPASQRLKKLRLSPEHEFEQKGQAAQHSPTSVPR
jgi:hypothetical protein